MQSRSFPLAAGLVASALALALAACGAPHATSPRVRFATATEQQLRASDQGPVWYEFQQGDEVPLAFVFAGVMEGTMPVRARATRPFWLVMQKGMPPGFSFDGEHVAYQHAGKTAMGLLQQDGKNLVGVVVYVGRPEDAPPAFKP